MPPAAPGTADIAILDIGTLARPSLRPAAPLLRLGYLPLIDAAPLLIAEARGLFRAAGLDVVLSAAGAWAGLRDRLAYGELDAAHLLGPMPIAAALGLGGAQVQRLTVAAGLGQNGNSIVLSHALADAMGAFAPPLPGTAFAAALRARAAAGCAPPVIAVVFPFSSHNYLLRHWLAAAGLDPDRDLRLTVVPPPLVAQALAEGRIDGFCAGEPWGSAAIAAGAGRLALATRDIWPDHPEKLLALSSAGASQDPPRAVALATAVIAAARWLDDPAHHAEAAALLQRQAFPTIPQALIATALAGGIAGPPRFRAATRPDAGAAAWFFSAMHRWGHLPADADAAVALAPWRNTIWTQAAAECGETLPPPRHTAPSQPESCAP